MPTRFWDSRAHISDVCVTQIPNRTFATPYVSRPFRSHARSKKAHANTITTDRPNQMWGIDATATVMVISPPELCYG